MTHKPFSTLEFPFIDAIMFQGREHKDYFQKTFSQNEYLEEILSSEKYFIVGEKGTGKTAYAVFVENFGSTSKGTNYLGGLVTMNATDYSKFIRLKNEKHLTLSDYEAIWKVVLLLIVIDKISKKEIPLGFFGGRYTKLQLMKDAVNDFYSNAFSPEISQAMILVENYEQALKSFAKFASPGKALETSVGSECKEGVNLTKNFSTFQIKLLELERTFISALSEVKIKNDYILFFDGIDLRPSEVGHGDYVECLKGLTAAIWSLNHNIFAKRKGGKIKAMLLIRPDIFSKMELHNFNAKLRDNSVFLDWRVKLDNVNGSKILSFAERLIWGQQTSDAFNVWNVYFSYSGRAGSRHLFSELWKHTLGKPRDVIAQFDIISKMIQHGQKINVPEILESPEFKRSFSDYLMMEAQDWCNFYYSLSSFEIIKKFFSHLKGKGKFDCSDLKEGIFQRFISENENKEGWQHEWNDYRVFIQLLYDMNMIYYHDRTAGGDDFARWSFRERSFANLNPEIRHDEKVEYLVNPDMHKSLNIGLEYN